jgi:hypothetical protein
MTPFLQNIFPGLAWETPWMLHALAALPFIWLIIRHIPPMPTAVFYPALRLLSTLHTEKQAAHKPPFWLVLMRIFAIAALIIAAAGPHTPPPSALQSHGAAPYIILVDNDASHSGHWGRMQAAIASTLQTIAQKNQPVALVFTAERSPLRLDFGTAQQALAVLQSTRTRPWISDHTRTAAFVRAHTQTANWIWWPSLLARTATTASLPQAITHMQRNGGLTVLHTPARPFFIAHAHQNTTPQGTQELVLQLGRIPALHPPALHPIDANAAADTADTAVITAYGAAPDAAFGDTDNYIFGQASVPLPTRDAAGGRPNMATQSQYTVRVPLAMPSTADQSLSHVQLRTENGTTALQTFLFNRGVYTGPVALLDATQTETPIPLLQADHFLRTALSGIAKTVPHDHFQQTRIAISTRFRPVPKADKILSWVQAGGIFIAFADDHILSPPPATAATTPDLYSLLPAPLRTGHAGRVLNGPLVWTKPQPITRFAAQSPFTALNERLPPLSAPVPSSWPPVNVRSQILLQSPEHTPHAIWARLQDGTPIISARQEGKGWLVFFHVTADGRWSDLPVSHLFVPILEHLYSLASTQSGAATPQDSLLPAQAILDANGTLHPPDQAIPPRKANTPFIASAAQPPGRYGRGSLSYAANLGATLSAYAPLHLPRSVPIINADDMYPVVSFRPFFVLWGIILLMLDYMLFLRRATPQAATGTHTPPPVRRLGIMLVLFFCISLFPRTTHAQNVDIYTTTIAADRVRLAYLKTGDAQQDATSFRGLVGLSAMLNQRTSVLMAPPLGISPNANTASAQALLRSPILYWPLNTPAPALSPDLQQTIRTFINTGGIILFDTADGATSPRTPALHNIYKQLQLPPMTPLPRTHVLNRSYYLLSSSAGRYPAQPIWGEPAKQRLDGVSSILAGTGDWAAAWALNIPATADAATDILQKAKVLRMVTRTNYQHMPFPEGEPQREAAFRFGINVVMYALTGNYKQDQIHNKAIMERLQK